MKVYILNLPNKVPIIRRFKCSYNAPLFLLPPIELAYLAGVTKDNDKVEYIFKDYMLNGVGMEDVIYDINKYAPELIITIVGIESVDDDLLMIKEIREEADAKVLIMGYLPSIYPEEFLKMNFIDFILMNEPEETYSELLEHLSNESNREYKMIKGLAYRANGETIVNPWRERIEDLDSIPIPDRQSLKNNNYSEPYFGKPFTTMLYSRGCPFTCNYCVRTYGHKVVYHSSSRMIKELKEVVAKQKIKYVRFMDDTFTINKNKVLELCNEIIKEKLNFNWICLSRPDTIDNEIAIKMKEAGCQRVYLGIESGSQKVLDYYKKGCQVENIIKAANILNKCHIEIFGFLMTGAINETDDDFKKSLDMIKSIKVDFVVLDLLMPYPGTDLFNDMEEEIEFSLNPYILRFKDTKQHAVMKKREVLFYKSFYFNIHQIMKQFYYFLKYPKDSAKGSYAMLRHFIGNEGKQHEKYI